jgi:hypothetical protein
MMIEIPERDWFCVFSPMPRRHENRAVPVRERMRRYFD